MTESRQAVTSVHLTYDAEKEALRGALRRIIEAAKPQFGSFPARLDQIRTLAAEALGDE